MSADLAAYTASDSTLDRLDRQAVVALLERGKTWLTMAVERDTEIGELAEFKGQAETIRVYTVQKQLGKDAELAARELVNRAVRGLALAIRKGQDEGRYFTPGQTEWRPGQADHQVTRVPRDVFSSTKERADAYAMVDGVSDENFETALKEAKEEGDLSRANVVRKVTQRAPTSRSKRPELLRRTRRIDSRRVIAATVDTAAANVIGKDLFAEIDLSELETQDLEEWISSLSESIRALTSLKTTLKKELSQRG